MIRRYRFSVSTNYVGSRATDIVEIEFEGNETAEEIEKIIEEEFNEWVWNNIDAGWKEVN